MFFLLSARRAAERAPLTPANPRPRGVSYPPRPTVVWGMAGGIALSIILGIAFMSAFYSVRIAPLRRPRHVTHRAAARTPQPAC
jgi:hypothetical protein